MKYLRRFIRTYSLLVYYSRKLLKKNDKCDWAFKIFRSYLASGTFINYFRELKDSESYQLMPFSSQYTPSYHRKASTKTTQILSRRIQDPYIW